MCTGIKTTSIIIIPQAAWICEFLFSNINPKIISAIPLNTTIELWAGMYGGIMRSYIFGFLKWFTPASTNSTPSKSWCQGNIDFYLIFKSTLFERFVKLQSIKK